VRSERWFVSPPSASHSRVTRDGGCSFSGLPGSLSAPNFEVKTAFELPGPCFAERSASRSRVGDVSFAIGQFLEAAPKHSAEIDGVEGVSPAPPAARKALPRPLELAAGRRRVSLQADRAGVDDSRTVKTGSWRHAVLVDARIHGPKALAPTIRFVWADHHPVRFETSREVYVRSPRCGSRS